MTGRSFLHYGAAAAGSLALAFAMFMAMPASVRVTVPEPTSMLLFGTGLLGLAAQMRRRFFR